MSQRHPEKTRRSPRRWIVPPGLAIGDEPFDGYRVLEEVRNGLGLLLWQTLRDAELWATTEPSERRRLFDEDARLRRVEQVSQLGAESPLRAPLLYLARVLGGDPVDGPEMSESSTAVSRWASENGMPRTAMAFAQAASMAAPDSAAGAYQVGILARRAVDYRRAETWFRRTMGLARRTQDWRFYGMACVGLGNVYIQRGDHATARAWLTKALRAARRYGLWHVKPMALHDLFGIAAAGGNPAEAEHYARASFRAYGRRHPKLVALAQDVGRFWLQRGENGRALIVFQAVLPHVERVPDRRLVLANLGRAAAGEKDRVTFAEAWAESWRLIDRHEDSDRVPESLIALAKGAAQLGDTDRAQMAAGQALSAAIQRKQDDEREEAEALLENLRRRTPMQVEEEPAPRDEASAAAADAFAADLVDALSADTLDG